MQFDHNGDIECDDVTLAYKIYKARFIDKGFVNFPSVSAWVPPEEREEYFDIKTVEDFDYYVENCFKIPVDQFPVKSIHWYRKNFNNIFRNQHQIENATVLTIENIVMCVVLKTEDGNPFYVSIQRVANEYAYMGVTLNQQKFPSVVFKYTPPTSAVQPVFPSGKIVSTGSQTFLSAFLALEKTVYLLKQLYASPFVVSKLEIKNLVGTGTLPFRIDQEKIKKLDNAEKGNLYAAVIYKPKVEYNSNYNNPTKATNTSAIKGRRSNTKKAEADKDNDAPKVCTLTFLLFPEGQYIVVGAAKQKVIIREVANLYKKLTK